jgi:hypothetical protein
MSNLCSHIEFICPHDSRVVPVMMRYMQSLQQLGTGTGSQQIHPLAPPAFYANDSAAVLIAGNTGKGHLKTRLAHALRV